MLRRIQCRLHLTPGAVAADLGRFLCETHSANNWSPPTTGHLSNMPAEPACQTCTDLLALAATRPNTPPAPPTAGAYRQQLALTGFAANDRACLSRSPRTAKACLPSMPPPDFTLPRILPRPQATWQRQGVNFELLKQSVMHDFGVVLLFGSFFYLLPLCCWFELPPTAGQQCCFWSG